MCIHCTPIAKCNSYYDNNKARKVIQTAENVLPYISLSAHYYIYSQRTEDTVYSNKTNNREDFQYTVLHTNKHHFQYTMLDTLTQRKISILSMLCYKRHTKDDLILLLLIEIHSGCHSNIRTFLLGSFLTVDEDQ